MTAVERVQYSVSPDDPNVTIAVKEAWVESGLYGFRSAVKSFGIERFKKNCHRATEGLNHVLEQLASQQHYLAAIRLVIRCCDDTKAHYFSFYGARFDSFMM